MKEFNQEEFGKRFLALREDAGLSGRAFCRKHGGKLTLNPEDWGNLEKGEKSLTLDTLVKYCIYFDRSPIYMLSGIGPKSLAEVEQVLSRLATKNVNAKEVVELATDNLRTKTDSKAVERTVAKGTKRTKKGDTDNISPRKNTPSDSGKKG